MLAPQVTKEHYDYATYMYPGRWASMWHQVHELKQREVRSALEIGPGPGLFKALATQCGVAVETLDIDPALKPDHLGSAEAMPLADGSFDAVCAFQMLEHVPYETSLRILADMRRVSRKHVVISLPDAQKLLLNVSVKLPRCRVRHLHVPLPRVRLPRHEFDGEHYWEINKRDYPLRRIIADFSRDLRLLTTYRVGANPYHRFFVFEKPT